MTNFVQNVAIIGAGGRIGGAFANALLQTGKHHVTALTRPDSNSRLPNGLKIVKVNYDDEDSIAEALKGQQFLVITLAATVPEETHARIVAAASKAGVTYVMPNTFCYPVNEIDIKNRQDNVYTNNILNRIAGVERSDATPVIMSCGFWYEWSLALGEPCFGFTIKDRKVTFFDDGRRIMTVSTWDQCGRALASLLSLPEAGASPSLADFKDINVLIHSFRVTQREMLESLHRVLGTTDKNWEIKYEKTAQRIEDGAREMGDGFRLGFAKWLYGSFFLSSNKASDFGGSAAVANGVLGLPKEDLDEATRRAVDMVNSGWQPFH
ncbi:hypothetical protein ACHAQA_006689 [Verticillium albo-atrum]